MFTLTHTQTKLVLKSQHKLPQLGLACCALLLFTGAWTAEPQDTAGQAGMSLAGMVFLAAGWFFFPNHTIVFDKGTGDVVSERRRLGRTDRQVIGLATIERVYAEKNQTDDAPTARLALRTATGCIPLETTFGSSDRGELVKDINDWLQT